MKKSKLLCSVLAVVLIVTFIFNIHSASAAGVRGWLKYKCKVLYKYHSKKQDYWEDKWYTAYNKHKRIGRRAFGQVVENALGASVGKAASTGTIEILTRAVIKEGSRRAASKLISKVYGFVTFPYTFLRLCQSGGLTGWLIWSNATVNRCAIKTYKHGAFYIIFKKIYRKL